MDKHYGWWVDLAKVTLADGSLPWVHALPFGEYQHPVYGTLSLDVTKLSNLASGVKQKVRGVDLDIDYDHKGDPAKGNQAAGWVRDAEVRNNGLYLQVDFTPTALAEIREKKYRYFSADFADEWTDSEGKVHADVLFGGGLTNRPFMKNLLPINLSDLSLEMPKDTPPEAEVDLKKLRELLGLAADATEEQVITKLTETSTSVTKLTEDNKKLTDEITSLKAPAPQVDPQLMKLVEASPAFKKMYEDLQGERQKLAEAATAIKLAEVKNQLDTLQTGKSYALAPAVREELEKILLKSDPSASKALSEFMGKVMEGTALVDLSERGYTGRRIGDDVDATLRFNEHVKQLVEKSGGKMDYGTAVEQVARENPQLFDEYRSQATSFRA
jgi:phage I-like protein